MRSNLISISISIHALREEGDSLSEAITKLKADFYPRPPRGGRLVAMSMSGGQSNFYPRPPRGGRRERGDQCGGNQSISIHALREEGDKWQF